MLSEATAFQRVSDVLSIATTREEWYFFSGQHVVELLWELKELCFGAQVPDFFGRSVRMARIQKRLIHCEKPPLAASKHVAFLAVAKIARRQSGEQKRTLKIPQHCCQSSGT